MLEQKAKRDGLEVISYRDVQAATGIAPSTLVQLSHGRSNALLSTVETLCHYFDCTPGELLTLESGAKP
jgi:DNA-binding Xre family transcriptional regulator